MISRLATRPTLRYTRLNKVFSRVPIGEIRPRHAYRYLDLVAGKHGQASANRDYEVLSHAFSVAIRWGLIDVHRTSTWTTPGPCWATPPRRPPAGTTGYAASG